MELETLKSEIKRLVIDALELEKIFSRKTSRTTRRCLAMTAWGLIR